MTSVPDYRARTVEINDFWHAHADLIDYVEERSADDIMSTHGLSQAEVQAMFARGEHIAMDCSEAFVTNCRWSGLPDPSGPTFNYNGYGNTGTILAFLDRISIADGLPGDGYEWLIPPGVAHITQKVSGSGENPMVFSNGDESGPYIYPLSDDEPSHAGQALACLSIAKLLPAIPIPPADPYHYAWFNPTIRHWSSGEVISETKAVQAYDAARVHPHLHEAELHKLHETLGMMAGRVLSVAYEEALPSGNPSWGVDHRGWRYQGLSDRARDLRLV